MKKKLLTLPLIIGTNLLAPTLTLSCTNPKPEWNKEVTSSNNKDNLENAYYDNPKYNLISRPNEHNEPNDKTITTIIGKIEAEDFSKEEILNIFSSFDVHITKEGKKYTRDAFYTKMMDIVRRNILGNGRYFDEGRISFEELFSTNEELLDLIKISFPDLTKYSKYNEIFFEIRYNFEKSTYRDTIILYAQIYHTDKTHVWRNAIENIIEKPILRHDPGYKLGPIFAKEFGGFKE